MGRYITCNTCGEMIHKYWFGEQSNELEDITKDIDVSKGYSDYHYGYFVRFDADSIDELRQIDTKDMKEYTIALIDSIVKHYDIHNDEMEIFGEY